MRLKQNLEDENPIVRVGNQFFRGTLEPIQGTAVCFAVTPHKQEQQSSRPLKSKLTYVSKTDKCFVMKRVFLKPKTDGDTSTQEHTATSSEKT